MYARLMIEYIYNLAEMETKDIYGFFVGWRNPPNNETFLKILKNSYRVVCAVEGDKLIGFTNAISDAVLSAYIPLLEFLPEYQGGGIGKRLVKLMLESLSDLYVIDLLCDQSLLTFYEKLGMKPSTGVLIRNYDNQNGVLNS